MVLRSIVAAAAVAACACAPARAPARTTTEDTGRWAAATWEDRHDIMTFLVLPNMARTFQHFQSKADPELTCRTCHGADAEAVQYAMPHGLPALDPAEVRAGALHERDPERRRVMGFMADKVTPQMGDLLGLAPYDAATGRGFSCFDCHPVAGGAR
ncbi:MAG: hypothetical protein ACLP1X_30950 [Polyangiaceae bacterium]